MAQHRHGDHQKAVAKRDGQTYEAERTTVYEGILPTPEMMAQYEAVQPGFADRILTMTEKEGEHRRGCDNEIIKKSFRLSNQGMWLGAVMSLAALLLSGFALYLGYPSAAATIACTVTVSLAYVFVTGRKAKAKQEKEQPD